ncbi:putative acetyltransferase [[Candida] jaroonii]|uniref:Acetyltransferase n=1 Tax=[Candida] jaroonii TaxID=467808 RepID=A0ACA9Y871_9ASCO|nr:putative acetyltransferase [[Candida] jaroonii]
MPDLIQPTELNHELIDYAYKNLNNLPKGEEYEKMISSLPYNCWDSKLKLARDLGHENAADYGLIRLKDYDFDTKRHSEARLKFLKKIFGKIDDTAFIEPPFFVDYGCNISIGKNFYGNFNITFLDCSLITIGDNVMIAPNVCFTTATHPTDPQKRLDVVEYALPITVGNNVWFGCNIAVLPGVTIGDGCVIGAGAIVNKSLPPYSVAVGNPARVIRTLESLEDRASAIKEVS